MRAAFGPFGRRLARQLSPRGVVAESSSSEMSEAVSGACSQAVQERGFHSAVWRPRASSAWSSQHERTSNISSSCSSLAATAAWQASVNAPESAMVEDWLTALHQVDTEARSLATGLLARHPTLLWKDCQRVVGVVQALVDAMRQRHLLRPYVVQDAHILAMVDRYTPESLRARLSEQHRLVWQKLDDSNVASLFASRTSLDMVDLDAKALALKAQALRALIPEFLPSTVLRGCPELLDVQVDDLPAYIRRVGDVVVVGKKVHAELVAPSNVVIIHSTVLVAPAASTSAPSSPSASATAGRLLRTARCGAQQLLKEQSRAVPESRTVTRVFCNSRQLVFADGDSIEARVEDPTRSQEDLSAACRLAVVQRVSITGQAAAGVRA